MRKNKLRLACTAFVKALGIALSACSSGDTSAPSPKRASVSAAITATAPGLLPPVIHDTGRGAIVSRAAQQLDGVDVFRGGVNTVMNRSLEPVATTGFTAASLAHGPRGFEKSASDVLGALVGRSLTPAGTHGDYQLFTAPRARAKRVYYPRTGGLEPGWYVELGTRAYVVSAITGKILFSNDLVSYDAATYRVLASPDTMIPFDGPQGNGAVPLAVPTPNGFKPTPLGQQLVTLTNYPFSKNDPWVPAGCVMTSGNNVQAFSDVSPFDGFTPNSGDTYAGVTSPQTFDYPFDFAVSAGSNDTQVKAGITQFFYTANFLHDWFYDSGFDEKSGNHQQNNYGRGGYDNDPLEAETDDYEGRDNAFAQVPADGASPTIAMFLFSGTVNASLTGAKSVGVASQFGADTFDVTGTVVAGGDACTPLPASVAGQIVTASRGNCQFVDKANTAQAAGALGIVIYNLPTSDDPNTPPFMGGVALDNTIPVLSLDAADGAALLAGVTVEMKRAPSSNIEGALDNQILTHEWGHILSNRLIADGSGLPTNQAKGLGEGWSDFAALLLTARADDIAMPANANWSGLYPIMTYAVSGASDFYFGIRRVPYSTDLTKDPLTFKDITNGVPLPADVPIAFGQDGIANSEIHNTGEIWASMLWEGYAGLLNRYSFSEAQSRMKGYLVASLKMTPPSPTFTEARDALLATAYAADRSDFTTFWKAFAKRGAGVLAVAPSRESIDNSGVVESFDVGGAVSVVSFGLTDDVLSCDHDGIVDEGEIGTLQVTLRNTGSTTLAATTATVTASSSELSFDGPGSVTFDSFEPFETKTAKVKVRLDGTTDLAALVLNIEINDPTFVNGKPVEVTLPVHHGVDEAAESSASDDVEPEGSAWTVTGQDQTGTTVKWARIASGANHSWFVPDAEEPADHRLTSPPLQITANQFTLSWAHRWSFEADPATMIYYDGGVVEISLDNGKTWADLSKYAAMDYNTTLTNDVNDTLVLSGRRAYGGTSPGYPDQWVQSTVVVTVPSAQATALVRFRMGTDDTVGGPGWEIDNIAVVGIDNTPFTSFVPQESTCDADAPTAVAPAAQTVRPNDSVTLSGTGSSPLGLPVSFSWRQDMGPPVSLSGGDTSTLSFTAPSEPATLTFALYASDGTLVGAPAHVDVTVAPADSGCGCRVGSSGGRGAAGLFALAGLVLVRRRRRV